MARHTGSYRHGKDISALVLRLVLGLSIFFGHGLAKWNVLFGGGEIIFPDPIGVGSTFSIILAAFAEIVCALLVAAGLLTRFALIPLIITMGVATFVFHSGAPFGEIELSLIYFSGFIVLLFLGPGKFSLDSVL